MSRVNPTGSTSRSAPATPAYIAERIAGWGPWIDVLDTAENAEVRRHLADIGRGLVERYGED